MRVLGTEVLRRGPEAKYRRGPWSPRSWNKTLHYCTHININDGMSDSFMA